MSNSSSVCNEPAHLLDRALQWLRMSERDSRWLRWALVLAAALYFIFIGVAETGPINEFGHDVFVFMDGGWRILNGQIPHRDFYQALGPLESMIVAGGMLLTHGSTQGIAIGNVAFGMTVGIWGWLLSRRRMPAIPALLVSAWLILTATSPTSLGANSEILSCAMIYNRHGYALLGIVLVECAFAGERSRFWGGVSSGIALVLMAFLKLNFFGVAGLLLLASIPLRREETPRLWGFLLGLAGTFAAFMFYLQFAIFAFITDMRFAIHARGSSMSFTGMIGGIAGNAEVVTLSIMTVVAMLLIARGGLWQRNIVRVFLISGIVIATGPLLSQTNTGEKSYQLTTMWVIVLLGLLTAAYPLCKEKAAISAIIAFCLGSAFAGFFMDAESVRTLLRYQSPALRSQGISLDGAGMERLKFYETSRAATIYSFDNGHFLVDHVNDGLALLKKSSTQDESIMVLGYVNPFTYALRRKPALGGSPWLALDNNFTKTHLLEANRVFGNSDLVMVPNYPSSNQDSDLVLAKEYSPYLLQHFTFVANSQWWSLYRRKK